MFVFKYYDFFIENINLLLGTQLHLLRLLLPLGISFFTFQQISYLVDNAHEPDAPVYSFDVYALYVSFFPQLIAGPIVLHSELVPQFEDRERRHFKWDNFAKGLMAFSLGLAKKVLIADAFALFADEGFAYIPALGTLNAAVAMLSYTFQIYFDFSGYCDMATGIALLFNIELPMNFNSPYKALTVTEFWSRWHMTLTRFFTKYYYIDVLGGNRKGKVRTYLNILLVFLISGLWHGANWTFMIWGLLHGAASVLNRIFKRQIEGWYPAISWLCTFIFVNIAWVFFRADSISQAVAFLRQLGSLHFSPLFLGDDASPEAIRGVLYYINVLFDKFSFNDKGLFFFFAFGLFSCLLLKNTNDRLNSFQPSVGLALFTSTMFILSVLSFTGISVFLYWNF